MKEKDVKKISIIGLGWLGIPLAERLKKEKFSINGSTTSSEKQRKLLNKNYNAFKVLLTEDKVIGDISHCLQNCETLILNTPPGLRRNPESNYVKKIEHLIPFIEKSSIKNVLYISSTSVFEEANNFPEITNHSIPNSQTNAGKQITQVEELLKNNLSFKTTILRFSGLIDERRHPVTMMSRRKSIPNPSAPTNLIHLNDCIEIILKIIQLQKWEKIYNASFPSHPSKNEYYTKQAQNRNLSIPDFDFSKKSKGKVINGSLTAEDLCYKYQHSID